MDRWNWFSDRHDLSKLYVRRDRRGYSPRRRVSEPWPSGAQSDHQYAFDRFHYKLYFCGRHDILHPRLRCRHWHCYWVSLAATDFELMTIPNERYSVPIYEIWYQATRSRTAATFFMAILLTAAIVALIAVQQTASRLTWSFARDNALVGSRWVGNIHSSLGVPVWALVANNAVVFIIGCVFLGSSTAFNAFIGTGLILQQVTYAYRLLC